MRSKYFQVFPINSHTIAEISTHTTHFHLHNTLIQVCEFQLIIIKQAQQEISISRHLIAFVIQTICLEYSLAYKSRSMQRKPAEFHSKLSTFTTYPLTNRFPFFIKIQAISIEYICACLLHLFHYIRDSM